MADNDTGTTPTPEPASGMSRFIPALPPILRGPFELANVAERAFRLSQAQRPQTQQPPTQAPGQTQAALPPPAAPMPPPNVPLPPPIRYSYIPPKADTPPENLGGSTWAIEAARKRDGPVEESAHIPSPRDGYRYGGQASGYLAKVGAPAVAGPAQIAVGLLEGFAPILDWLSGGGFSRNYSSTSMLGIQRQLGALKVQQEQAMLNMEIAAQAQQKIDERYGRVFTLATTNGKDGKPLLSGDELEDAVRAIAVQDQDNSVLVALQNGGLPQAIKQMQQNQQQRLMLEASHVALKKMTAGERTDAEIQAQYGETTDQSGQGLGASSAFHFSQPEDQTAPAGTAPVSAPGAAPKTQEEFDNALKKDGTGLTDQEIQAAHDRYDGKFDQKEWAKIVSGSPTTAGKIDHAQREIAKGVDEAANSDATPEDKLARIGTYSPNKASELRGLYDYTLDPKQHKDAIDLTKRVFGDRYKEGNYDAVKKWEDENSATRKNIDRIGSIPQSMLTAYSTLNRFDENSTVVQNKLQQWWAGTLGGDDKYKVLFDSLFDLDQHFQAVASFTGTPRVGPLMKQIENLGSTATPSQVRNVIDVNARSAYNALDTYQTNWQKLSNRNTLMPGIDSNKWAIFRDFVRVNKMTGQMPTDAQPESLAVSRDPSQAKKGLTDAEKLPPLTMEQIRTAQARYHELATSPDADKRKQAKEILDRIGPIISIGKHIPEVDD